jgi:5-methylthioadenosine/S-adenosylhomocysteine deaminase
MYMGMEHTARVLKETGMRGVLSRGLVAFSLEEATQKLRENVDLFEHWHERENGRIRVCLGPHGEYTNTLDTLKEYARTAIAMGMGVNVHVAETKGEVEGCYQRHNASPVEVLNQCGIFDVPAVAAHCVHVSTRDMDILKEKGVGVAHNPVSNMKLSSGYAPITAMRRRGIAVGLGTDGVASNNRTDMMIEANLASLLAKGSEGDPTCLSALETLRMATWEGARVLGLESQIGSLKAGKQADMIMVDVTGPCYQPPQEMINHMVYSASSRDVEMTMVDGAILMENGKLTTLDLPRITEHFLARVQRLYA